MKNQVLRHLYEGLFAQQYLKNFLRALCFHRQLRENFIESRNREASPFEFLFDQFFGPSLFGKERDFAAGFLYQIAGYSHGTSGHKFRERGTKNFRARFGTAAQFFLGDSGSKRIRPVKLLDRRANAIRALRDNRRGYND